MHVDHIIVGQGICGTLLSYMLVKRGHTVLVIDDAQPFAAGMVASGLVNPVTGMRVAKSWLVDELYPAAVSIYSALEEELQIRIMHDLSILEFHPDLKHREVFNDRIAQYPEHLSDRVNDATWNNTFNFHYGIGEVTSSFWVDMRALQSGWRRVLAGKGYLKEERFDIAQLRAAGDGVEYNGFRATNIVFCNGAAGATDPYFERLPFALNKGEALIAAIPGLSPQHVYKNGIKITPWQNGNFWVGASFEWTFSDTLPSPAFRARTEAQLNNWLKLPYTILDHLASVRPATVDHKPFAGFHPLHPAVGIFNGMGAKGCLQAPFFAASLADHMVGGTPLHKEVDINRYARILSRPAL